MSRLLARSDFRWPSSMTLDLVSGVNVCAEVSQLLLGLSSVLETFLYSFPNSRDESHLIFCTYTNQFCHTKCTKTSYKVSIHKYDYGRHYGINELRKIYAVKIIRYN